MNLFYEERATYLARQEAINACLDALAKDLENYKVDLDSNENMSELRLEGKT